MSDPTPILKYALNHNIPYIRQRAGIVLMTLDGKEAEAIAADLELTPRTVKKWQEAWAADGLDIFPADVLEMTGAETEAAAVEPQDGLPPMRLKIALHDAPGIEASDAMWEAGRKLFLFGLEQMLVHERVAKVGEDIEGVHKMRVATRRMRSAFDVFGDYLDADYYAGVRRQLRQTAHTLGAVRDLDVLLVKTQAYIDTTLESNAEPLQPLLDAVQREHKKARKALMKWLKKKKFDRFIVNFYSLVNTPDGGVRKDLLKAGVPVAYRVESVVPRLIYGCMETVRAYEPHLEDAPIGILHALRIDFKRLRYTLEFFEEVLGDSAKQVIKAVKEMQDHLGDLNDASVAVSLVKRIRKDIPKGQRKGVSAYLKARREEADYLVETFPAAWDAFNQQELREALALAVAAL